MFKKSKKNEVVRGTQASRKDRKINKKGRARSDRRWARQVVHRGDFDLLDRMEPMRGSATGYAD